MGWRWKNPGAHTEYDGLYKSWNDMHKRAGNKDGRNPSYSDVLVCERWKSYDNFFDDMSSTWWKGATLDKDSIKPGNRIYCPEYCKWMSKSENDKEAVKRNGHPMSKPEIRNKISKSNHYKAKKVECIELKKVYNTPSEAEDELKLPRCSVSAAANPNKDNKTAGGYHWKYTEE